MTVLTDVKPEVVFDVAVDVGAEMLIRTYVPEYDPATMTLDRALALAELRDEQAALDLEAAITAALDSEEDPAEGDVAADVVNILLANMELETAAIADREEQEASGSWEAL